MRWSCCDGGPSFLSRDAEGESSERAPHTLNHDPGIPARVRFVSKRVFSFDGRRPMLEIRTWYRWEEVLRECRFAALARPRVRQCALLGLLPEEFRQRVELLPAPGFRTSRQTTSRAREPGEPRSVTWFRIW